MFKKIISSQWLFLRSRDITKELSETETILKPWKKEAKRDIIDPLLRLSLYELSDQVEYVGYYWREALHYVDRNKNGRIQQGGDLSFTRTASRRLAAKRILRIIRWSLSMPSEYVYGSAVTIPSTTSAVPPNFLWRDEPCSNQFRLQMPKWYLKVPLAIFLGI